MEFDSSGKKEPKKEVNIDTSAKLNKKKKENIEDQIEPKKSFENSVSGSKPLSDQKSDKEDPLKKAFQNENRSQYSLPPEILGLYTKDGDDFYHKKSPKELAFVDKGDYLEVSHNKNHNAALVSIAKHREWPEIHVAGSKPFRQDVWRQASEKGITVHGYRPSEKELSSLKQTLNEQGGIDKKEINPTQLNPAAVNKIQSVSSGITNPDRAASFEDVATKNIAKQNSLGQKDVSEDKPREEEKATKKPSMRP